MGVGRPDNLGVMADIAPAARGAVIRENTGLEHLALIDPASGHFGITKGIARPHPQILALSSRACIVGIMLEPTSTRQLIGIDLRRAGQGIIPA